MREAGWWSPALSRRMELKVYGHSGRSILLFPTAGGVCTEAEERGLVDAIGHLLEEGRFRLYCCGSVSGESWLAHDVPPSRKTEVQAAFDNYLVQELVPFMRHEANDALARFIVTGASLGAYNAVNAHEIGRAHV